MKLIVDAVTDKILGAAMVGPDSAEIMQASRVEHVVLFSVLLFRAVQRSRVQ